MVLIKTHHHRIAQEAAADQENQAFERLEKAWEAVRAHRLENRATQFDEAYLNELDAAEEAWLSSHIAAFLRS